MTSWISGKQETAARSATGGEVVRLSPLNFSGLIGRAQAQADGQQTKGHAVPVYSYACSECDEIYDDEDEAAECCSAEEDGPNACPICGGEAEDARDASDCCLWKDLDAPTRWRMADAVDAGSTWAEQLQGPRK